MSVAVRAQRTQVWLDGLGEWSWPGQRVATAEVMPPAWVPVAPRTAAPVSAPALPAPWLRARRVTIAVLLALLAAVSAALALHSQLGLDVGRTQPSTKLRHVGAHSVALLPTPKYERVSSNGAGSMIEQATYASIALHHGGSFYVYLPPGYRTGTKARYPVIYLLHGNDQAATAFLQIGLQGELDHLIAEHKIPPMIAVMVQGGRGANNWRNLGASYYESYVLEAQEIVDRTLPTLAKRGSRAVAGLSMGGYGAMELTLNNPYRFGVVESWLGFFNGLEDQLRLDHEAISRLGLHAFLYGGSEDKIADPSEDAPFAAKLRAAGASASSAIYPGEHNLRTIEAHLASTLTFAGRSLAEAEGHGKS
jgi:enterochelin esterase-like enzyme